MLEYIGWYMYSEIHHHLDVMPAAKSDKNTVHQRVSTNLYMRSSAIDIIEKLQTVGYSALLDFLTPLG